MKRFIYILILLLIPKITLAIAYLPLEAYEDNKKTNPKHHVINEVYVHGVGMGLMSANSELEQKGLKPLYCTPTELPMTSEIYNNILDEQIKHLKEGITEKEWEYINPVPISGILLRGLKRTFPCK